MSLASAVTPSGDPYAGGTLARAGNPTAVGGSFASAGAQGFPAPGQPGILSARNNSGSNVRIPYARLVPMRNDNEPMSHRPQEYGDHRWPGARPLRNEYDGLESGELAWILGRRFLTTDGGGYGADDASFARGPAGDDPTHQGADGAHPANTRAVDMTRDSAHGMGIGYGPDRMQRLAYTDWMEAFFPRTFGKFVIDLVKTPVADNTSTYLSSEIQKYAPVLYGASLTESIDVPQVYDALFKISAPTAVGAAPTFDGTTGAFRGTVAAGEYTVAGGDDAAAADRNTAVPAAAPTSAPATPPACTPASSSWTAAPFCAARLSTTRGGRCTTAPGSPSASATATWRTPATRPATSRRPTRSRAPTCRSTSATSSPSTRSTPT